MNLIKNILKLLIVYRLSLVVVGVTVYWFTPKPKLSVFYAFTSQRPYKADALGQLHLDYKETTQHNRFQLLVESVGTEGIKDLEIDIVSMKKNLFSRPTIIFDPITIEKRVLNQDISKERIYLKMVELPQDTSVALEMDTENIIEEADIDIAVMGSGRRWPSERKEIVLSKHKPSRFKNIFSQVNGNVSEAYAAEQPIKSEENINQVDRGSGVYLGGYDPVRLTNELFLLLQKKGVLTKSEAENIVKVTKEGQGGVAFGGVNVLKFDEAVLNVLLQKNVITMDQGNAMLERPRNAGGVLINGYNVIQLKAEILNALIQKSIVTVPCTPQI